MQRKRPLMEILERATGRRAVLLGQSNPVDESRTFTIIPVGEPLARIDAIRVRDEATGSTYNLYPEEVPAYCTPGAGNLLVTIHVTNVGIVGGVVFCKLYGNGVLLDTVTLSLVARAGDTVVFLPAVDMPERDYTLTVEVGH